jgi:hypothetical protein
VERDDYVVELLDDDHHAPDSDDLHVDAVALPGRSNDFDDHVHVDHGARSA